MSYQIFNEASLGKFIELIQNKVRSIVDNATVASARSATNATNDADGNPIKTTYRKVADSYSKTEVDNKVANSPKSITITTDDLIANYTFAQLLNLLEKGTVVYLKTTNKDPIVNATLNLSGYSETDITWSLQYGYIGQLYTDTITIKDMRGDGAITLFYARIPVNTLTDVSTINIAVTAWDSASKTATVSVPLVTADNAVDVAPAGSSFDDYVNASIRATAQSDGKLTFACKTIPTKTISVNIKAISTKPLINNFRVN